MCAYEHSKKPSKWHSHSLLHHCIYKFMYNNGFFLVYNFMSFDKFKGLCNHHHDPDTEKFQYSLYKLASCYLLTPP